MRVGIAADHRGFAPKEPWASSLKAAGYNVADCGAHTWTAGDDYSAFVLLPASGLGRRRVERGYAVCGTKQRLNLSGVREQ